MTFGNVDVLLLLYVILQTHRSLGCVVRCGIYKTQSTYSGLRFFSLNGSCLSLRHTTIINKRNNTLYQIYIISNGTNWLVKILIDSGKQSTMHDLILIPYNKHLYNQRLSTKELSQNLSAISTNLVKSRSVLVIFLENLLLSNLFYTTKSQFPFQ